MKKIFVICLLMAVGSSSFAQESKPIPIDEAIKSAMEYITTLIAPGSKVVVSNFSAPTEELSKYIIEDLSAYIVNSRTLTVVERRNVEALENELDFQMSGYVSDETAQSIASRLGAQSIISGSISQLGRNYRFRVQAVAVETWVNQGVHTVNVEEDATLSALLGNRRAPIPAAKQRFGIGAQAGTLFGLAANSTNIIAFNKDVFDPGNFGFLGSLYAAYAFNSLFRLSLGVNIAFNNLDFPDRNLNGALHNLKYLSLDIPLLANFYVYPWSNVLLRISLGPYLSLPRGDFEYTYYEYGVGAKTNTEEVTYEKSVGLLAGIGAGYRIGNGNIIFDLRYLTDFIAIDFVPYYNDDSIRRGITVLLGYEHWF